MFSNTVTLFDYIRKHENEKALELYFQEKEKRKNLFFMEELDTSSDYLDGTTALHVCSSYNNLHVAREIIYRSKDNDDNEYLTSSPRLLIPAMAYCRSDEMFHLLLESFLKRKNEHGECITYMLHHDSEYLEKLLKIYHIGVYSPLYLFDCVDAFMDLFFFTSNSNTKESETTKNLKHLWILFLRNVDSNLLKESHNEQEIFDLVPCLVNHDLERFLISSLLFYGARPSIVPDKIGYLEKRNTRNREFKFFMKKSLFLLLF